jgi:hypothetical protein
MEKLDHYGLPMVSKMGIFMARYINSVGLHAQQQAFVQKSPLFTPAERRRLLEQLDQMNMKRTLDFQDKFRELFMKGPDKPVSRL